MVDDLRADEVLADLQSAGAGDGELDLARRLIGSAESVAPALGDDRTAEAAGWADAPEVMASSVVSAAPPVVFEALTNPRILEEWFGPPGVVLESAEINPRRGGRYALAMRMPDESTMHVDGVFLVFERPRRLAFSWHTDFARPGPMEVDVRLSGMWPGSTLVEVRHHGSPAGLVALNALGWTGSLQRLTARFD